MSETRWSNKTSTEIKNDVSIIISHHKELSAFLNEQEKPGEQNKPVTFTQLYFPFWE